MQRHSILNSILGDDTPDYMSLPPREHLVEKVRDILFMNIMWSVFFVCNFVFSSCMVMLAVNGHG